MNGKKVTTPICDFVEEYRKSGISRFHMPGHKGKNLVGCESADITEISGADVLYSADGIIAESEQNATRLFGTAHTFYSTEGSSLSIKAMLALAVCGKHGKKTVLAARNAHKAFVYGCALLDIEVEWLYPKKGEGLCSCPITSGQVKDALCALDNLPCAVYITSPDYLGNIADVSGIAKVCDDFGVPLLVDNAHGAYLKFLKEDIHPITLGAHMCCDSAHKTLPVLTGGGYLHISKKAPSAYVENARNMLSVFASTSPSYLILQSLDACNRYIAQDFSAELEECTKTVEKTKKLLESQGVAVVGDEKTKLVIDLAASGFAAGELEKRLCDNNIEVEFSDGDHVVLMASPLNNKGDFERLESAFDGLFAKKAVDREKIFPTRCEKVLSIRQAVFAPREIVPTDKAPGRICGCPTVSCPPAIPIVTSGERIDENAVKLFKKYGIFKIDVVIE
ncbi:MAG: hypothetical protein E7656_08685 [Ruminococcaceae bacterium]|nr:hypothetical protein [Oscillospiraceae bacterium]